MRRAPAPRRRAARNLSSGKCCPQRADASDGGSPREALDPLEQATALLARARFRQVYGHFTTLLGEAHLQVGDLQSAHELIPRGLEIVRETGYRYALGWALRALGRLTRAACADVAEARHHLTAGLQVFLCHQCTIRDRAHPTGLGRDRRNAGRSVHDTRPLTAPTRNSGSGPRGESAGPVDGTSRSLLGSCHPPGFPGTHPITRRVPFFPWRRRRSERESHLSIRARQRSGSRDVMPCDWDSWAPKIGGRPGRSSHCQSSMRLPDVA